MIVMDIRDGIDGYNEADNNYKDNNNNSNY